MYLHGHPLQNSYFNSATVKNFVFQPVVKLSVKMTTAVFWVLLHQIQLATEVLFARASIWRYRLEYFVSVTGLFGSVTLCHTEVVNTLLYLKSEMEVSVKVDFSCSEELVQCFQNM